MVRKRNIQFGLGYIFNVITIVGPGFTIVGPSFTIVGPGFTIVGPGFTIAGPGFTIVILDSHGELALLFVLFFIDPALQTICQNFFPVSCKYSFHFILRF